MIPIIPIPSSLRQPQLWRVMGFISSVIGLLCYALSSSFKHLFGEWNLLKIFLYTAGSFIMCSIVLFAKKWQLSRSLMLKAHVGFLVLMLTSVYSFFYDRAVNGKPNILGLISCIAFAMMSFSLSRQIDLGFEVDLLNFFLGCLTIQLMKINLMLAFVGAVFCYILVVLRSSLDSQQQIATFGATTTHHVAIEIDAESRLQSGADHYSNSELQSENRNDNPQLQSLRKRHFATTVGNTLAAVGNAAVREHALQEIRTFQFSNAEFKARRIVAAMKIQHAFRNYRTRNMTAAATRIQHTFRAWKIRKESLHMRHQAVKIQAAFRGFQVRKQYSKTFWSIGVIEKAILRWRFKRRGFRRLYVNPVHQMEDQGQENDVEEEKQAKELAMKFAVHVQAMLRSKKAQQEYNMMKLVHNHVMVTN